MIYHKTYSELVTLPTFLDRYHYLKIGQQVGDITFGHARYLNQIFYKTEEWKQARRDAIIRDFGHDLGMPDEEYEIKGKILIHHINPITMEHILSRDPGCYDLENLICVSKRTHDAIHYSDEKLLTMNQIIERSPNDTCPWK